MSQSAETGTHLLAFSAESGADRWHQRGHVQTSQLTESSKMFEVSVPYAYAVKKPVDTYIQVEE